MKLISNLIIISVLFLFNTPTLKAETVFLDFQFILGQSSAGKKANQLLKSELEKGIKSLKDRENKLQKEEKDIIQQKKILSPEEYKKKISNLRSKVSNLQKDRQTILNKIAEKRNKARSTILKSLNPIVKEYMAQKNVKIVLDKKSVLLANDELDITKDIMQELNKNLKTINLN